MPLYLVNYSQTSAERYDTDTNERARQTLEALGLTVHGSWGGCSLDPSDPVPGDQGFEVEGTPAQAAGIREALRFVIGLADTLTITEDTDLGVQEVNA